MSKALGTPLRPWEDGLRIADESREAAVIMAGKILETLRLKLESLESMEAVLGIAALH